MIWNYEDFSLNESLVPSIGDYVLVDSPKGKYYRHKNEELFEIINGKFIYNGDFISDGEYDIEPNGYISFVGNIIFNNTNIVHIPILFNRVDGNFLLQSCEKLESLKGSPLFISNHFSCGDCKKLKNLIGSPIEVQGNYNCSECEKLETLEGCSKQVGGHFMCDNCDSLINLSNSPVTVGKDFTCYDCSKLTTFGLFKCEIGESFKSKGTGLTYLDGFMAKLNTITEFSNDKKIVDGIEIIQKLYRQYPLLSQIEDYALFVHTIIGYAPELKQYYKEIPKIPEHHQDLSTFL